METNHNLILPEEAHALAKERRYSVAQWGDPSEFDNNNTLNDWVTYICMYATDAARMTIRHYNREIYDRLIKSANLALLAAEHVRTGKRGLRHYDESVEIGPERRIPAGTLFDTLQGDDFAEIGRELQTEGVGGQAHKRTDPETEMNIRRGGDGIPL